MGILFGITVRHGVSSMLPPFTAVRRRGLSVKVRNEGLDLIMRGAGRLRDMSREPEDGGGGEAFQMGPIVIPDFLRPIYANYINVNHTPWDFRMTFAVVQTPMPGPEMQQVEATGLVEASAVADIILPANLVHGLIMALNDNYNRYLSTYGVPGMNPEGPEQPTDPTQE